MVWRGCRQGGRGGGGPEDFSGGRRGELGGGRLVLGQAGRLMHVWIRLCVHLMCRDEAGTYKGGRVACDANQINYERVWSQPPQQAARPLPSPSQLAPAQPQPPGAAGLVTKRCRVSN